MIIVSIYCAIQLEDIYLNNTEKNKLHNKC